MNIRITNNAWSKMIDILKKSNNTYGFLYSASSGGCNGFNFNLDLLSKNEYKNIINHKYLTIINHKDNYNLYVDPLSEMFLMNTEIDYIQEDYKNNIFENKFIFNVDKTKLNSCGCGISFSLK